MGLVCITQGNNADAIDAFKQAIKIKPDFGDAWRNLVGAHAVDGDRASAIEALKQLRKLDPEKAAELEKLLQ